MKGETMDTTTRVTKWLVCRTCRATTRHDDRICIHSRKNAVTAANIEKYGEEAVDQAHHLHRDGS